MPVRRYNFTGRRRLRQEDVQVVLHDDSRPLTFGVSKLALAQYNFPTDANVCVEVYRRMSHMRFPCGTIGKLDLPNNEPLDEFDHSEALRFRIKVIDTGQQNGRLLGELSGRFNQERDSLLPVEPSDSLEQEVIQLDFTGEEPVLLINSTKLPDWKGVATDPVFVGLVYPTVLRSILSRILQDRASDEGDDDPDDWRSRWIRFAASLPGISRPPEDAGESDDWIDDVVGAFCRSHRIYDDFYSHWTYEGGQ